LGAMTLVYPIAIHRTCVLLFCLISLGAPASSVELRVGVPNDPPVAFVDSAGDFRGIYVETLDQIAQLERWKLLFESVTLVEGVAKLQKGHLDLLIHPPSGHENAFSFTRESPVMEWGVIIARPQSAIVRFSDLRGHRVAVPENSAQSTAFLKWREQALPNCHILMVKTQQEAIAAVTSQSADAAVVSNLALAAQDGTPQWVTTPIVLNPMDVLIASPRGLHEDTLQRIDEVLAEWKQQPDSFLQQTLVRWLPPRPEPPLAVGVPPWPLWIAAGLVMGLVVVLIGLLIAIRRAYFCQPSIDGKLLEELRRSEQRYRNFVESIPFGLLETDPEGNILFANAMEHQICRYRQGELPGKNILDMASSLMEKEKLHVYLRRMISGQTKPDPCYTSLIRQDGIRVDIRYEWSIKRAPQGEAIGLYALVTDVTETILLKDKIITQQKDLKRTADQRANELMEAYNDLLMAGAVFDNTSEAILVMALDSQLKTVNPAFSKMTGYAEEEITGEKLAMLSSKKQPPAFFEKLWKTLEKQGHWQGEIWPRKQSGEIFAAWLTINAVRDAHEQVTQYVALLSDITRRKQYEQQIWRQANFDALTGLPNRNLFYQRLGQAVSAGEREHHMLAVMFIDLDKFKNVNDTLGHDAGDELLKAATRRIASCVEKNDTVARMGGDEFTVILPKITTVRRAALIAGGILEELNRPFDILGNSVEISGSIGIVIYPHDGKDLTTLLKHADIAMYHIKESGRNGFSFYGEMNPPANEPHAIPQ